MILGLKVRCYVLGCRQSTVIGCRHRRFGRVVSCPGHNPIAHAYDVALVDGTRPAVSPALPALPAADVDGGTRVPVHPAPAAPAAPAALSQW
jgi:hypothetical protein